MKPPVYRLLTTSVVLFLLAAANAATVTVTVRDDAVNIGAPGTFYWALTNCGPGDTIAFNIPGAGPHFLLPPSTGFPIIYQKHRIIIDGYTQPGAVPNSNPITAANNAQIKIVIDGRNNAPGNIHGRSMDYSHFDGTLATSDPPIDNTAMALDPHPTEPGEFALLGIYRSTNVTIKGLAFLADDIGVALGTSLAQAIYAIHIAHDYGLDTTIKDALEYSAGDSRGCHVAGCWFGVNPANPTKSGVTMCANWINFPRHQGDDGPAPAGDATRRPQLPNVGLTIGVAPGSANPRAEFNVIVGAAYHFGGEPLRLRVSGNFIGMMPDGITPFDMSTENATSTAVFGLIGATVECGRYGENYASSPTQGQPMIIGTDGDGVNDADEGNLWGPIGGAVGKASLTSHSPSLIHWYRSGNNVYLIAGNTWGIGIDGRRFTNSAFLMSGLYLDDSGDGKTKLIIGSDMASTRSAATIAAQANHLYNNWPLEAFGTPPTTDTGIVPFLEYENPNPNSAATTSTNAWVSLRGNVLVGNGLAPINYANGTGSLLTAFTNFFVTYLDTSVAIIPSLYAGSNYPYLSGTFAPGIAPFTNVTIDVYQLDSEGWSNGLAFALSDLGAGAAGFPQGRKYIGSFPVPNTGSFNLTLPGLADTGPGLVTVTANYSQDPLGTPLARTATSDFSDPVYLLPGGVQSVGLTHVVPDVLVWYNQAGGYVTNGPIANLPDQAANLGNWEPNISVLGDSTFLIEANTFVNDLTPPANQNNIVILQPTAGGAPKLSYAFSTDAGVQFKGQVNLSRQNGNPGRVAGDKRPGAVNYITAAETSLGQLPEFQSDGRWTNNPIYLDLNRYVAAQPFSLDIATLVPTPLTKAWDFVYGPVVKAEPPLSQPEVSRTGGTVAALDNGNFVIVIHDKTGYTDPAANVTTFAIITPTGTIVKTNTLVDPRDIWDNVAAFQGGFAVRCHEMLYFYDNAGNLQGSVDANASSGLSYDTGRGDGVRTASDIRSQYVYIAARSPNTGTGPIWLSVWDANTRAFVAKVQVDDQAEGFANDRTSLAVDALNRVCVAWVHQPAVGFQNQIAARVLSFDGAQFTALTHSFFPFVNYDPDGLLSPNGDGITTIQPSVAMTTRQICIAAKGILNNLNNPANGGNTAAETTVYTVISHPAPVTTESPTVSIIKSGDNVIISWNPDAGSFTVQTRASLSSGSWANATAGDVPPPVSLPIGPGAQFIRLAK